MAPVLPVLARASGLALLGGSRVSVVRILDVPDAVTASRVLGPEDVTLRQVELRRWDPDAGTVRTL